MSGNSRNSSGDQSNDSLIKLSVRELIEFSARKGNLSNDSVHGPSAREGVIGHQQIQQSRDKNWSSEVALKAQIELCEHEVELQGRVDLVNDSVSPVIIEELKTTYHPPDQIPQERQDIHWAQCKIYGYLYYLVKLKSKPSLTDEITCSVSWFDLINQKVYTENQCFTFTELKQYTEELIQTFLDWYEMFIQCQQKVVESASQLNFPFENYRQGQHHFAQNVYFAIREKKQLLVEAPTGTGKTMSTLFPSVKAIGQSIIQQIVYLTAKGSAQKTVLDTLKILTNKGLKLNYLVIQAKDKTCPCRSKTINVVQSCLDHEGKCKRTIGFFDRLAGARVECLQEQFLTPAAIQKIADKHQLCPFELSLQMVRWSSLVICDFNYLLDPFVRLTAFDQNQNQRVILIDEIHNLVDRSREMYSSQLSCSDARSVLTQVKSSLLLSKQIKTLIRQLNRLTQQFNQLEKIPNNLITTVNKILEIAASSDFEVGISNDFFSEVSISFNEWLKQLYHFCFIQELYSDSHVLLAVNQSDNKKRPSINLKIRCLDASSFLTKKFKSTRALVGFSATLSPLDYFHTLLGLNQESARLILASAFPPKNQLTIRCDYIDTRWQYRHSSLNDLAKLIISVYQSKPGKYLVFFPSYAYLEMCLELFQQDHPQQLIVTQQRSSDEQQRALFLNNFLENTGPTLGFAILGGVFGEGVDYAGDALNGAIIIGTGMPQPNEEQKLLEQYLESQSLNAYQYAYQYPGFMRVKQTAGRVIRSEKDQGVVVLVDPRFRRPDYQELMPTHWQITPCSGPTKLEQRLSEFWQFND